MRRLDVDAFFRRRIDPSISVLVAREHERVDAQRVHHAKLKVHPGWRD